MTPAFRAARALSPTRRAILAGIFRSGPCSATGLWSEFLSAPSVPALTAVAFLRALDAAERAGLIAFSSEVHQGTPRPIFSLTPAGRTIAEALCDLDDLAREARA